MLLGLAVLGAAGLAWTGLRLSRQLNQLAASARDLVDGNCTSARFAAEPTSIGDVARSLNQVYNRSLQVSRLKSGLDAASTMVMISNATGNIVYVNPALQAMFDTYGDRVRAQFPDVDPSNLIGTQITKFYATMEETSLADATTRAHGETHTHEAIAHVGGRKLRVRVSPVIEANGRVVGSVTQWDDRTTEFEIETEIGHVVDMISMGELDIEVSVSDDSSAYFKVAQGVNELISFVRNALDDLNEVISAMARGDLSQKIEADYSGRFGEITSNTNAMVSRLAEIVSNIQSGVGALNGEVETIKTSMENLAVRSRDTAEWLTATSGSTSGIAVSIQETAQNAKSANEHAKTAAAAADAGRDVVGNAAETMTEIESSSKRVSDIVSVIDEIAFQTNLLALNAAVEAARAGEAGKGFSVVAAEVRSLAQRASESAADIKRLVELSMDNVRRGVQQAQETGETLADITSGIKHVAQLIESIDTNTGHQQRDVVGVAETLARMDQTTQQNNQMAEDTARSIRDIADLSERLRNAIAFFGDSSATGQSTASEQGPDGDPAADLPEWQDSPLDDQLNIVTGTDLPPWEETALDAEFAVDAEEAMASTG